MAEIGIITELKEPERQQDETCQTQPSRGYASQSATINSLGTPSGCQAGLEKLEKLCLSSEDRDNIPDSFALKKGYILAPRADKLVCVETCLRASPWNFGETASAREGKKQTLTRVQVTGRADNPVKPSCLVMAYIARVGQGSPNMFSFGPGVIYSIRWWLHVATGQSRLRLALLIDDQ